MLSCIERSDKGLRNICISILMKSYSLMTVAKSMNLRNVVTMENVGILHLGPSKEKVPFEKMKYACAFK